MGVRRSLVVAALFAAAGVCGETPECGRAAERLRSDSLKQQARGAHLAAACQLTGLAAEIGGRLERLNLHLPDRMRSDSEEFWAGRAMLDALIRLRKPLEPPVLMAIFRRFPAEGTILMLQDESANRALLSQARIDCPDGWEWIAASSALTRLRAPGFAMTLLREIQLSQWIVVSDSGRARARVMVGSPRANIFHVRVADGFPRVGVYGLVARDGPDEELVSAGVFPIFARCTLLVPEEKRALFMPGPSPACSPEGLRIGYLAELAAVPEREARRAIDAWTGVKWTTPAGVRADIFKALSEQKAALRRLVGLLFSAGLLETIDLDMSMRIEVLVDDERSDRTVPLPEVPPSNSAFAGRWRTSGKPGHSLLAETNPIRAVARRGSNQILDEGRYLPRRRRNPELCSIGLYG
jgi:hypothetical protein